jgi:hypothetical protein
MCAGGGAGGAGSGGGSISFPGGGIDLGAVLTVLSEIKEDLRAVARAPFTSPAHLAHDVLETLGKITGGIVDFVGDGAPFLSLEEAAVVAALKPESALVKHMTPLLWDARGLGDYRAAGADVCPLLLINSEKYAWLDDASIPLLPQFLLKPDLFASWAPFFESRGSDADATADFRLLYGVLADRSLQLDGGVCELYAAKLQVNNAAFGELCNYHRLRGKGLCRGMLLGSDAFWLYESHCGNPLKLIKSTWVSPGSLALVRSFFGAPTEPPLVTLLRDLLSTLNVRVRVGVSFLGAGGSGRVFAVTRGSRTFALKAAVGVSQSALIDEFSKLSRAFHLGAPVVSVVSDSLHFFSTGGGYLMDGLCAQFVPTSKRRVTAAFAALAALHAKDVFHGDARVQNLLVREDEQLVWADFMCASIGHLCPKIILAEKDALALASSILGRATDLLPDQVRVAAKSYADSGGVTGLALINAVASCKFGSGGDNQGQLP